MKRIAVFVVCALVCGCTSQQVRDAGNTVASAAPVLVNDALIVAQVEGAFVTIDGDSALHTAVASHDGAVRLSGRVRSASVRDRFIAQAKTISGVKSVASTLNVDTRLPTVRGGAGDLALTVAVEASLAGESGVNALPIHVEAHGGIVTLTGPVKTAALRATVLDAARATKGVRAVRDHLNAGT